MVLNVQGKSNQSFTSDNLSGRKNQPTDSVGKRMRAMKKLLIEKAQSSIKSGETELNEATSSWATKSNNYSTAKLPMLSTKKLKSRTEATTTIIGT